MNKFTALASVAVLTMGATVYAWADKPCMPIAQECMKSGYTQGDKTGKDLVEDCVKPVVGGQKTLPGATFSDATIEGCKAMLMSKAH